MAVRVDAPEMWDALFFQETLSPLADIDESILVAARQPEQRQLFFCLGRIRNQFSGHSGVGR